MLIIWWLEHTLCSLHDVCSPIGPFCLAVPYLSVSVDAFSESGEKLAHCQINTFVRGAGGFGGHRNSDLAMTTVSAPSRPPDGSTTETIGIDQVTANQVKQIKLPF